MKPSKLGTEGEEGGVAQDVWVKDSARYKKRESLEALMARRFEHTVSKEDEPYQANINRWFSPLTDSQMIRPAFPLPLIVLFVTLASSLSFSWTSFIPSAGRQRPTGSGIDPPSPPSPPNGGVNPWFRFDGDGGGGGDGYGLLASAAAVATVNDVQQQGGREEDKDKVSVKRRVESVSS